MVIYKNPSIEKNKTKNKTKNKRKNKTKQTKTKIVDD
jgi:hypothetical protein